MIHEFEKSIWFKIGITVVILLLIYYLRYALLPFAVSFVIAYILNPIVNFVQRFVKKRIISVIITLLAVFVALIGIGYVFIPKIIEETNILYVLLKEKAVNNDWQGYYANIPQFVKDFIASMSQNENLESVLSSGNFTSLIGIVIPKLGALFSNAFNFVTGMFGMTIIILYTIFIMIDFEEISNGAIRLIPQKYEHRFRKFITRFLTEMNHYFHGQISIVLIVMVLYATGFGIIGLPMGVLLGIFVGLLNLVPYLQIIGFFPALVLSAIKSIESGQPFWLSILLTAMVFVIVQIIQDMVLTPKIMGKNTGLNPAMILLSLSIWGKLLGFLGLIVAIPFTCLVKSYYADYLILHNNKTEGIEENEENKKADSN